MAFTSLRGWLRLLSPGCWPGEAEFWADKASGIADKLDGAHWSLSNRESRRWAQQASKAGAKLAHRWSKDPGGFKPQARAMSPNEAVGNMLEEWKGVWGSLGPFPAIPSSEVEEWLPPLIAQDIRAAAR